MKVTYHIPTEQYGYIEIEGESKGVNLGDFASYEDVKRNALGEPKMPSGEGLDDKEWRSSLDEYLMTNTLIDGTNLYEKMSPDQKKVFQEVKKAFKRINKPEIREGYAEHLEAIKNEQ